MPGYGSGAPVGQDPLCGHLPLLVGKKSFFGNPIYQMTTSVQSPRSEHGGVAEEGNQVHDEGHDEHRETSSRFRQDEHAVPSSRFRHEEHVITLPP